MLVSYCLRPTPENHNALYSRILPPLLFTYSTRGAPWGREATYQPFELPGVTHVTYATYQPFEPPAGVTHVMYATYQPFEPPAGVTYVMYATYQPFELPPPPADSAEFAPTTAEIGVDGGMLLGDGRVAGGAFGGALGGG